MKKIKDFFKKTPLTTLSDNEEVNKIHCGGLSVNEFVEKHKDVEMKEITIKPLRKVWNEIVTKLKYSKPKQRLNYIHYMDDEVKEIYGKEVGDTLMNILGDLFEGEYYKINNGTFEEVGFIIHRTSEKTWIKTVNKVNILLQQDIQIQIS